MTTDHVHRDHNSLSRQRCTRRVAMQVGAASIVAATLAVSSRLTRAQVATPVATTSNGVSTDVAGLINIGGRNIYYGKPRHWGPHSCAPYRRTLFRPLLE